MKNKVEQQLWCQVLKILVTPLKDWKYSTLLIETFCHLFIPTRFCEAEILVRAIFFYKIWNFNLFVLLSIGHEVAPPCIKSRENELLVSWSVIGQLPKILSSHWLKLHRQLVHSCLKSEWIVFTKIASNWYSLKIVEWKYLHEIFS